jgi:hypothetical protein
MTEGASPSHLARQAERLEKVAAFVSRPDCRTHILEKAAEFRAEAVLRLISRRYAGDLRHAGCCSADKRGGERWT